MSSCTVNSSGKKICTGPPGNNPEGGFPHGPPDKLLIEVPSGAIFEVQTSLDNTSSTVQPKDGSTTQVMTPQQLVDLSNHGVSDDKLFFLEIGSMYTNMEAARYLVEDMAGRVPALKSPEIIKEFEGLAEAVFLLKARMAALYTSTNAKLFPDDAA